HYYCCSYTTSSAVLF
nr:immunoglobulin light chain junction region [Macaca mulatta]